MMLPNFMNVMPVREKRPLISWKHLIDAAQSTDEKAAILEHGAPGNIGIVTGPVSRVFVLDIDGPKGEKSLEGKFIPRSWSVKTPKGRHVYFRWDSRLDGCITTNTGLLEGVDTRGYGGYVVFYGWEQPPHTHALGSAPKWLVDLLPKKEAREITVQKGALSRISTVKEGTRNDDFFRMASSLRARGCKPDEIFAFLEPKAKEVAFPPEELRSICDRMVQYRQGTPLIQTQVERPGESVESFLAEQVPINWICKPFIAEQSIGIVGGLPESRKSWILVDLAVEHARGGGLWMGKFPVTGGRVLLIDQERSKGEVQRRLKAVIAGKGLDARDIGSTLFVRSGTTTRIDQQQSFDALRREVSDLRPTLILVDSFATFHTKEESNRMEIQQVMERIKQIRNEFQCSIQLIHHATKQSYHSQKDGGEPSYIDLAGNVAIPAAAEMCLGIVKHDDESSFVHHTKSTQGVRMAPFLVKVKDLVPDGSKIVIEAY